MMILHRLFSITAQIAFPQSRQTNFHIFSIKNAAPASLLRKTDAAEMA